MGMARDQNAVAPKQGNAARLAKCEVTVEPLEIAGLYGGHDDAGKAAVRARKAPAEADEPGPHAATLQRLANEEAKIVTRRMSLEVVPVGGAYPRAVGMAGGVGEETVRAGHVQAANER